MSVEGKTEEIAKELLKSASPAIHQFVNLMGPPPPAYAAAGLLSRKDGAQNPAQLPFPASGPREECVREIRDSLFVEAQEISSSTPLAAQVAENEENIILTARASHPS